MNKTFAIQFNFYLFATVCNYVCNVVSTFVKQCYNCFEGALLGAYASNISVFI